MNINGIKALICSVFGVIGSAIATLFGGWTGDMTTLLIFMGIDFVMGLILAGIFKNSSKSASGALESRAGWKGLCRKGVALFVVLVAHRLDLVIGVDYIKTATVIAFIVNEAISIIENAGLMGLPMPKAVTKAIEVLKNKSDGDDEEEGGDNNGNTSAG